MTPVREPWEHVEKLLADMNAKPEISEVDCNVLVAATLKMNEELAFTVTALDLHIAVLRIEVEIQRIHVGSFESGHEPTTSTTLLHKLRFAAEQLKLLQEALHKGSAVSGSVDPPRGGKPAAAQH